VDIAVDLGADDPHTHGFDDLLISRVLGLISVNDVILVIL
jgi:hypothetical protein